MRRSNTPNEGAIDGSRERIGLGFDDVQADAGLLPLPVTAGKKETRPSIRVVGESLQSENAEATLPGAESSGKDRGHAAGATSKGVLRFQATANGIRKSARIQDQSNGMHKWWVQFRERLRTGSSLSESMMGGTRESSISSRGWRRGQGGGSIAEGEEDEGREVDEIVVDNDLRSMSYTHPTESEPPPTSNLNTGAGVGTTDNNSKIGHEVFGILALLRWRVFPFMNHFFGTRFIDDGMEVGFRREIWFTSKSLALYSSLFFVINWILIIGFGFRPYTISDKIIYFGVGPLLTLPLPLAVVYDWPRSSLRYHLWVGAAVWIWPFYNTVFMFACHFYPARINPVPATCGTRDFSSFFYYTIGLQVMALFGLRMARIANAIGVVTFFILNCILILPVHPQFTRNLINMLIFHGFLLYVHYKRETCERRLYSLRDQLKVQFRATQKAQVNERKASDSKSRLTSYVFHEVRVPLNTALLAVQNLEATGTIRKAQELEWVALGGSLSMMSKVLNDVLDFDRLDAGRFSTVNKPYNFHETIKSILVPLGLAATQRGLTLKVDLDKNIDLAARRASFHALEKPSSWIDQELSEHPDDEGLVVGDEMRLRQILNNLASNACKFTLSGGEIRVVTRLVYPTEPHESMEGKTPRGKTDDVLHIGGERDEVDGVGEEVKVGEKDTTMRTTGEKDVTKQRSFLSRWSNRRKADESATASSKTLDRHHSLETLSSGDGLQASSADVVLPSIPLTRLQLSRHNSDGEMPSLEKIVVRIEVHDTGVGIHPKELIDKRLFSPYVQTEIGRSQGGKGTGLGLALIRWIVKLSGGRMGVKSKLGHGSTFWFELPLGVGKKAVVDTSDRLDLQYGGSPDSQGQRQRALGLEEIKFFREINDGETPSVAGNETEGVSVDTVGPGGFTPFSDSHNSADPLLTPPEYAAVALPVLSREVLEGILDKRVPFELLTPPKSRAERASDLAELGNGYTAPTAVSLFPGMSETQGEKSPETAIAHLQSAPSFVAPSILAAKPLESSFPGLSIPASRLAPPPPPPQVTPTIRVLVVDDDMLTRRLMQRMLTRLGCSVDMAENGEIALQKIVNGPIPPGLLTLERGMPPNLFSHDSDGKRISHVYNYDVIFLDNQMPVMSGTDTVFVLRALGRKDLVIGVTGNALLSDQQEYLDVGVDRVLTKPVFESSLKSMLSCAYQRRQEMKLD